MIGYHNSHLFSEADSEQYVSSLLCSSCAATSCFDKFPTDEVNVLNKKYQMTNIMQLIFSSYKIEKVEKV